MKYTILFVRICLITYTAFSFVSCTSVSSINRSSLQLIPDKKLIELSNNEFEILKRNSKLSEDKERLAQIERVVHRLSLYVPMPSELIGEEWEFILIEDDDVTNAFAFPSAKIGVYTGLFKIAKSDADLAIVIGHEMGHVVAKHGGERMSQQMVALGGSILLSQAINGDSGEDRKRLFRIYNLGSTLGVLLPYSRLHENEADRLGLIYMAKAGYDPRLAISFWERMEKEKLFHIPELISTHPTSESRIMELNTLMDEAMLYYNP